MGKVGVNPPVPHLVGMDEGVAGDEAPEAHVVQLGLGHRLEYPAGSPGR